MSKYQINELSKDFIGILSQVVLWLSFLSHWLGRIDSLFRSLLPDSEAHRAALAAAAKM